MSINLESYDYVDFGCSNGGSMEFAQRHLKGQRGLGIDIDERKVAAAKSKGYEAQVGDLTKPQQFSGHVRFSTIVHFLEHVPSATTAHQILGTAALISEEFVFIRQPWFDSDGALASLNLKLYWSDWTGHTNHMTSLQLYISLLQLGNEGLVKEFSIFGHYAVKDTSDTCLIPLNEKRNSHHYNPSDHGSKNMGRPLPCACFRELVAQVATKKKYNTTVLPPLFQNHSEILSWPPKGGA